MSRAQKTMRRLSVHERIAAHSLMQTRSKRRRVSTLWSRLSAGLVIHVCTFLALPDMAGAGIVDKATERVWRESSLLVEIVLARDTIGVTNAVFRAYIQSMPRQWYVGGLQKCLRPVWNWTRPERFLIWACSSGNLAAIRMCFEASPVLRTSQRRAEDNRYAVRLACRGRDRLPIAKYLFEVQRFDKSDLVANTSILYDACRCSSVDVVRYLVGVGEMTGRDALGNKVKGQLPATVDLPLMSRAAIFASPARAGILTSSSCCWSCPGPANMGTTATCFSVH